MLSEIEVRRLWREADAVCFDVDSTVCQDEGLDALADFCGVGLQVAEWTKKAMGGNVSFREALSERLNIVKPSEQKVQEFIASNPPKLSPGVKELISLLQKKNRRVFLVSGGFRSIIAPVAALVGVAAENIYANKLLFDNDGNYAGFDLSQPTSESGGKSRVAQAIKDKYGVKTLCFIGDGVTDMEACPPADAFIGFGGNVIREKIRAEASWFVTDFAQLIEALES